MTGGTDGVNLYKQCVLVAIHFHVNHIQEVSTGFAFGPKRVPSTTPERDVLGFQRLLIGFFVHEA